MKIVLKLVLADMRLHPARLAMTSLAVIAAACTVIWVVSGYDALLGQFDDFAAEYLGRYELVVVSNAEKSAAVSTPEKSDAQIPTSLVDMIGQDPSVAALDPVMQASINLSNDEDKPAAKKSSGPARMFRRPRPTLVGTDAKQPPFSMVAGDWIGPECCDRMEAAISSKTAELLKIGVGDTLAIESTTGKFRLKILGIVDQAAMRGGNMRLRSPAGLSQGPAASALYVPLKLAEKISGQKASISYLGIDLKPDTNIDEFKARWIANVQQHKFPVKIYDPADVGDELKQGRSAGSVRKQAYSATGISLLAALFIILTTLSMGVHERIRQFAVLRAVALTRAQVASMIAIESLALAVIGWGGGLAAGWGLLRAMSYFQGELFKGDRATLGFWAIVLSGACAFGGALAASIIPAWRATRIDPLAAMAPYRPARRVGLSPSLVVLGLALTAVNPLLIFLVPMSDAVRYAVYAGLGCVCMAVGFVLLAPLFIVITEKIFVSPLAFVLRLDGRLLKTQLSGNLWRALGTTVALTLGLGLFVAMQVWGYTMLGPFVPGDWAPDLLVSFQSGGVPKSEIESVRGIEGVIPEQCLPLAVEQAKFAQDITGSGQRTSIAKQDNVIMIGLDPRSGIGGDDPLLKLNFVQGNRADAVALLERGRHCIVPKHFVKASGLNLGDSFELIPPAPPWLQAEQKPVKYTIAGVVTLPGWHWMTKFSGLRRRSGRSAAMVFAAYDDVRKDFKLDKINFFWMNTDKTVPTDDIGKALERIAERNMGHRQPVNAQGTWTFAARMFGSSARVTTPEDIRRRIGARADGMIWGMCYLPLVTLAVTALGVVNAVLASLRARRWEMGVLRAIGLTRSGLFRMILAEAILIGLAACMLSLVFGMTAGWCGVGISQYVSFFGGMDSPLIVPWSNLLIGFSATLALCLTAALWPAVSTGRMEPLALLQSGRGSM